jgi:hypothetical protein
MRNPCRVALRSRWSWWRAALVVSASWGSFGCDDPRDSDAAPPANPPAEVDVSAFIDDLERRTFDFFWERSAPGTGLTPDRWPTESFSSVAAVGFALTAYPIGAERGYVMREEAARRTLDTLLFFWNAPQDSLAAGVTGYRGFFYHFLDMDTGHRFEEVELSTIDTALFLAGALFSQSYFDRDDEIEARIRATADSLYLRADWQWASPRPPIVSHGWNPEGGFLPYDWGGYNEAMILYVLALASPTYPIPPEAWDAWTETYLWGEYYGQNHVAFTPLFGHQYSAVWIDFRGIQDAYMREREIDYFENGRRATIAQRAYAIDNPGDFAGYGPNVWGLTACDGPTAATIEIDGKSRTFHTYWGRGASLAHVNDDGTICPSAAGGSIVFAPEIVIPALMTMRDRFGDHLYARYGFLDSFNPTLDVEVPTQHGHVVPGVGWFDGDYLGIDQGPILAMIENYRSELVWQTLRTNPHIVRGLQAAGFAGGWLDEPEGP